MIERKACVFPGYTSIFSDVSFDRITRLSSSLSLLLLSFHFSGLSFLSVSVSRRLLPASPSFLPSSCSSHSAVLNRSSGTAPLLPSGVTAPTDSGWSLAGTLVHSGGQRSRRRPRRDGNARAGPVSWLPGGSRLHRPCAGAAILTIPSVR